MNPLPAAQAVDASTANRAATTRRRLRDRVLDTGSVHCVQYAVSEFQNAIHTRRDLRIMGNDHEAGPEV